MKWIWEEYNKKPTYSCDIYERKITQSPTNIKALLQKDLPKLFTTLLHLGSNVPKRFTTLLQKIDARSLDNTPISYIWIYKKVALDG